MRFRIDLKHPYAHYDDSPNVARYDILVDGERRGLQAVRDRDGRWGAEVVGASIIQDLWDGDRLLAWLRANVDADILTARPPEPQFEMEL